MDVTRKQLDDYAKYKWNQWSNNLKAYGLWDWLEHEGQG